MESRNETLAAVANKTKISKSTIHRIITGQATFVSQANIEAIAKHYNIPKLLLSSEADDETLYVGVGFCMWGIPFTLKIMEEGGIPNVLMTSFGVKSDTELLTPQWHGIGYGEADTMVLPPIIDNLNDREGTLRNMLALNFNYVDSPPEHTKVFTANDLVDLLYKGELDAIVVPSEVYEYGNSNLLIKVASICYTAEFGCQMIMIGNEKQVNAIHDKFKEASNTTTIKETLGSVISEDEAQRIPIILTRNTVSEEYFNKYIAGSSFQKIYRDTGDWINLSELINKAVRENDIQSHSVFVIGWQPQISWLEKYYNTKQGISTYVIDFMRPIENESIPYLSFDIMFSRARYDKLIATSQAHLFLKSVEDKILELNRDKERDDVHTQAQLVSIYYNVSVKEAKSFIKKLNFKFMLYPEILQNNLSF